MVEGLLIAISGLVTFWMTMAVLAVAGRHNKMGRVWGFRGDPPGRRWARSRPLGKGAGENSWQSLALWSGMHSREVLQLEKHVISITVVCCNLTRRYKAKTWRNWREREPFAALLQLLREKLKVVSNDLKLGTRGGRVVPQSHLSTKEASDIAFIPFRYTDWLLICKTKQVKWVQVFAVRRKQTSKQSYCAASFVYVLSNNFFRSHCMHINVANEQSTEERQAVKVRAE